MAEDEHCDLFGCFVNQNLDYLVPVLKSISNDIDVSYSRL